MSITNSDCDDECPDNFHNKYPSDDDLVINGSLNNSMNDFMNNSINDSINDSMNDSMNDSINDSMNDNHSDNNYSNNNINYTDIDDKKYMDNTEYMGLVDCTDQDKHMFSNISDQINNIESTLPGHLLKDTESKTEVLIDDYQSSSSTQAKSVPKDESPLVQSQDRSQDQKQDQNRAKSNNILTIKTNPSKFGSQNIDLDIYYEKILGKGSFSRVFPGKYRGELVAVKIISTKHLKPEVSKQLQRELQVIRILQKTPHNNIASYYKILQTDNKMIIVMELCSGGELTKYIKNGLDLETVRKYFLQILDGYKHLIELDIVHRDIKAANILLSQDKQTIKFIDFGLSKICTVNLNQTICGSPLYMAPELLNHQNYDSRSDIWSLGVVLYEMVYGVTPFYQCKVIKTLKQAIQTNSINYPDKNYNNTYNVPPDLVTYIKNLLHLDPSQRIDWNDLHSAKWLRTPVRDILDHHLDHEDKKNKDDDNNTNINYQEDYNELSLSEVQERIHIVQTVQKNLNHQHKKIGSSHNPPLSSSPRSPLSLRSVDQINVGSPLLPVRSYNPPPPLLLNGNDSSKDEIKEKSYPNKNKTLKGLHGVPKITNLNESFGSFDDDLFDHQDKFNPRKEFVDKKYNQSYSDDNMYRGCSQPIPIPRSNKQKRESRTMSQNITDHDSFFYHNYNNHSPKQEYIRAESFGRTSEDSANHLKIEDISLIDNEYGNEYDNVLNDQKNMASDSGLINVNDINEMLIANVPEKTTAYEYISKGSASIGHYIYSRSAPLASSVLHGCKSALSTIGVVNNLDP
jgi:serine/threonine protein kinase